MAHTEMLSQLKRMGKNMVVSFVKTINGINKYKVEGSPELQLLISVDKENKIETLLIQPFNPD